MPLEYFAGGRAPLGGLQQTAQTAQDILAQRMAAPQGPGSREMAGQIAEREALERMMSQTAGLTGPGAALAQRRSTMMAPVMAQKFAEQRGAARAADVEAREAAIMQALQARMQAEQQRYMAEQAERERLGATRRGAIGGLFDVGSKVGTALAGGA